MVLDKEEQRKILLELINSATFPGQFAEEVVALKQAVTNATVETKED